MKQTEQHNELRRTVRKFVETELDPHWPEWEKAGAFPAHDIYKKAGNLGLLGINKDEAYGGLGLDYSYQAVFAEEIGSAIDGAAPLGLGVQTTMASPALANFGSDALKQTFLAPAIAGDMVCSIAVSEPAAGSDVAQLKTTAIRDGDDYIINGTKMWITNSTQADFLCLLANTGDGPVHKNKSLIIVPTKTPGISFSERLDKLGLRASDTAQIFFDDVRVPVSNRIGAEGYGFMYQMQQFQEERLWCALSILKSFENCIDQTIDYCRDRQIFGKSVLDNQYIHYQLAEMQADVEMLRATCYQATEQLVAGEDVTKLATVAKLKAGRLSRTIPDNCLQFWGGMGFMNDNIAAKLLRDLRPVAIGGGTDETMLGVMSKIMGIAPAS